MSTSENTMRSATDFVYIPAVDGLRTFAVFLVFAVHTYADIFPGGFVGVDIFFAISGFLITSLLLRESDRYGRPSLRLFYARRALRILPALVVCVISVYLFFPATISTGHEKATLNAAAALFSFMNWYRASWEATGGSLGHTWSLSIEEQFYFFWSVVLVVFAMLGRRRLLLPAVVGCIVFITIWRVILYSHGATPERLYNGLDTRADALLAGCILAMLPSCRILSALARLWYIPALMLGVIFFTVDVNSDYLPYGGYTLITAVSVWILIAMVYGDNVVTKFFGWRPMVWMGKRSYSFYLWHLPVIAVVGSLGLSRSQWLIPAFALSIIASMLSYSLVERPFLRAKIRMHAGSGRNAQLQVSSSDALR